MHTGEHVRREGCAGLPETKSAAAEAAAPVFGVASPAFCLPLHAHGEHHLPRAVSKVAVGVGVCTKTTLIVESIAGKGPRSEGHCAALDLALTGGGPKRSSRRNRASLCHTRVRRLCERAVVHAGDVGVIGEVEYLTHKLKV